MSLDDSIDAKTSPNLLDVENLSDLKRGKNPANALTFQQFGRCGRVMKHPAGSRLTWHKTPSNVLIIKKIYDSDILLAFVEMIEWFIQVKEMGVWIESTSLHDPILKKMERFQKLKNRIVTFREGRDNLTNRIDLIVCLGGDGTLLYASQLFQKSVPPIMAFHLGSLGFLTPFQFKNYQVEITNVLEIQASVILRSRFCCAIHRKNNDILEPNSSSGSTSARELETNHLVLNDVVIHRGQSPYLCHIDLALDGNYVTTVQGDGLIVSTPTGSTAYAMAAGGSMIHPSVPAVVIAPICPHSLSFRPIVIPKGVELQISMSPQNRSTTWISFDGRHKQELFHGDYVQINASDHHVPSICAKDQITDWFDSLAKCLEWNTKSNPTDRITSVD